MSLERDNEFSVMHTCFYTADLMLLRILYTFYSCPTGGSYRAVVELERTSLKVLPSYVISTSVSYNGVNGGKK